MNNNDSSQGLHQNQDELPGVAAHTLDLINMVIILILLRPMIAALLLAEWVREEFKRSRTAMPGRSVGGAATREIM